MIIGTTLEIELHGKKIKHYESLGYDIPKVKDNNYRLRVPKGTKLLVKIEDIPLNSHEHVPYECDYCYEKGTKSYVLLLRGRKIVHKDCCGNCIPLKKKDVNLIKYGVEHTQQLDSTKEKFKETMLKVHGVEFPSQSPKIREKVVNTYLEKYGETNPMKNEEIRNKLQKTMMIRYGETTPLLVEKFKEKAIVTNRERYGVDNPQQNEEIKIKTMKTMNQNGNVAVSLQQRYIHSLIGGIINYLLGSSALDIAIPEEKVYVEYDGSGHDLSVYYGVISSKEFKQKEIKRSYALQSRGWREIRIVSAKDKLPSDEKILEMMEFSRNYLNTGRHYIKFNIDKGIVKTSQFEKEYDFGKLRKIRKEDIELQTPVKI